MYGNVTKEEIEKVVNEVMTERNIQIEYYNDGKIIKVSSPDSVLVGPTKVFDDAMIELVNEKYKPKR